MRLILASASPRRLQLLKRIGITPAEIIPADIDETPRKAELPALYTQRVAEEKALFIAGKYPQDVVLAADTVVACGRRILPKAEDEITARKCLDLLSGRRHRVYTAVCLYIPPPLGGRLGGGLILESLPGCAPLPASPLVGEGIKSVIVQTHVRFNRLSANDITQYMASNEWKGKAGGYAIQGLAERFIPWIGGSYSNVVGLPLAETGQLLKRAGIQ